MPSPSTPSSVVCVWRATLRAPAGSRVIIPRYTYGLWPRRPSLHPPPRRTSAPRARGSTPGSARSSPGTSTPPPAVRSGSITPSKLGWDPRARDQRRSPTCRGSGSFQDEWLRGGPVERWVPKGLAGQARVRVRDRRHHRRSEDAHRVRGLPHRLRDLQRDAARRALPARLELADAGPLGPAPPAPVGGAPGAVSRRHRLLRGPGPALGDQADQEGLERAPAGLQGPRHRPGGHDPAGQPRHPVHVHHAEAAGVAGAAAGVDGDVDPQDGHHRHLLAAAPSSRRSGTGLRTRSCWTAPT